MPSLSPYFDQVKFFSVLPKETQRTLEERAELRRYRKRQVIHFEDQTGDFVFLLCEGRVRVYRASAHGREIVIYLHTGPDVFGETGLIGDAPQYGLMAETLDDCLVAVFRRSQIVDVLNAAPNAALEMLRLVSERRKRAESMVADLVFLDVPKRLAKVLLGLLDTVGTTASKKGDVLKVQFTHQELAGMIGSTRETTTVVLNDFKRQGTLDFSRRKIVVRSRAGLEQILTLT